MTDKTITDLTEVTSINPNDYLVVETAAGNTRKIKKSNAALGGRATPAIVQKATLRGDGTIALPAAPTVGNLLVLVMAGFNSVSLNGTYKPSAFSPVQTFFSNANNAVALAIRRVQAGDTGSYAMSTSDNQAAVLYEVSNCAGVYPLAGGDMSGSFSGSNFSFFGLASPYSVDDIVFGGFTHDTTPTWTIVSETGLVVDYVTPADGQNHTGAFFHYDRTFDGTMTGSTSSNPTAPASGLFVAVGKAN